MKNYIKILAFLLLVIIVLAVGHHFHTQKNSMMDQANTTFGDDGDEGGTVKDNSSLIRQSMIGKWQSSDDVKFVREFRDGGIIIDNYDKAVVATGTWKVAMGSTTTTLEIIDNGTDATKLNFSVSKITPDELQLIYLGRGNFLNFKRIK